MKIVVTATSPHLEANIDPRFGRCQYFLYVDPETLQFEVSENLNAMAGGGAGIATAQAIASKGVEAVLTGNCGPNAYQVLSAAGIKVVTGVAGKVKDAVQDYKAGKYQTSSQPNVSGHFGMGRGMGGGRGIGVLPVAPSSPTQLDEAQEIASLKALSQELAQQISDIQSRIEKLEKK